MIDIYESYHTPSFGVDQIIHYQPIESFLLIAKGIDCNGLVR
jgi:hypothetical protein